MEVRIQAIHFEASERLVDFINKKAERLARRFGNITTMDVNMKVVKPETAMNKEVSIGLHVPQSNELVATKVANSFEEAVDNALEALERQLEKIKNS